MKRYLICLLFGSHCSTVIYSQNNAIQEYNKFKQKAQQDYEDFRQQCNAKYAEFLKTAWCSYEQGPVIPKPKDEKRPPVIMSKEDREKAVVPKPVTIDDVLSPVQKEPQPVPISPIHENHAAEESVLKFTFFGTEGCVRIPHVIPIEVSILDTQLSGKTMAKAWEVLSDGSFDNLIRDCLALRIKHKLCDWAYILMLRELTEAQFKGRCNAATMMTAWIYCQSGYQMRLALSQSKLYLLIGSEHHIYDWPYFTIDTKYFYPFLHKEEQIEQRLSICGASLPKEQPLSLYINEPQLLTSKASKERVIKSPEPQSTRATAIVNENLIGFYNTYPTSMIGDDVCTRWAMYANTPMEEDVKRLLYPQLRKSVQGKSQLDAANILLNWVQTGFVYEYDDKVWGGDRAFFAEETLYYPYCDCEDRSILFTRLIRDLLHLDCILVYYPGHLAAAVCFTEVVNGDYIDIGNRHFVITDPTYIGAPVGLTMPDMNNKTAKVILLE